MGKFLLVVIITLTAAAGCRKTAEETAETTEAPAENAGLPDRFVGNYRGFVGEDLGATMALVKDGKTLTGYYFYDRVGDYLTLEGKMLGEESFRLHETGYNGDSSGVFEGRFAGTDSLFGDWKGPKGRKFEFRFSGSLRPYAFRTETVEQTDTSRKLHYMLALSYPVMEYPEQPEIARNFNLAVAGRVGAAKSEFDEYFFEELSMVEKGDPFFSPVRSLYARPSWLCLSEPAVSLRVYFDQYAGGAHGAASVASINYSLEERRELFLEDLFRPEKDYLQFLSSFHADELKEQQPGFEHNTVMFAQGLTPDRENFRGFYLSPKGLLTQFQTYQIGPHAVGAPVVRVPYKELAPYLKEDAVLRSIHQPGPAVN